MADVTFDDLTRSAKDALHLAVGFGVITAQKAQVRRRELTEQVKAQTTETREQVEALGVALDGRRKEIESRLGTAEEHLDELVDTVADRLPPQAGEVVKQTASAAREARDQVRHLVTRAA